jgi:hypothetical protein
LPTRPTTLWPVKCGIPVWPRPTWSSNLEPLPSLEPGLYGGFDGAWHCLIGQFGVGFYSTYLVPTRSRSFPRTTRRIPTLGFPGAGGSFTIARLPTLGSSTWNSHHILHTWKEECVPNTWREAFGRYVIDLLCCFLSCCLWIYLFCSWILFLFIYLID